MLIPWEKKLDILGPIAQATRCLDLWLVREKRHLNSRQKQRVAALMARYFHYEDEVTDELILSFLDHYSGSKAVDIEDPTSVRLEIKAVLDQSVLREDLRAVNHLGAVWVVMVLLSLMGVWELSHKTITRTQQAELKAIVQQIIALDPAATPAAIWAGLKDPMGVRRYQDISWWRYPQSRALLEKQLNDLSQKRKPPRA